GTAGAAVVLVGSPVLPHLVVAAALLGIREHLVGLVDLLEARLGLFLAGVHVGVELARQPAVGRLDLFVRGRLGHTEDLVVVLVLDLSLSGSNARARATRPRYSRSARSSKGPNALGQRARWAMPSLTARSARRHSSASTLRSIPSSRSSSDRSRSSSLRCRSSSSRWRSLSAVLLCSRSRLSGPRSPAEERRSAMRSRAASSFSSSRS